MTVALNTHTNTAVSEAEALIWAEEAATTMELEAFLRDPIGYGDYDFGDPISLGEFSQSRHVHGTYAASIV